MDGNAIPESHPLRGMFASLAARGLEQADIRDEASIRYVSNLMTELVRIDDLYRVRDASGRRIEHLADLVAIAEQSASSDERKRRYRHLGDFTLFMLGLFPENLDRPRRPLDGRYYERQGRRFYNIVADLAWTDSEPDLFRRLSGGFGQYVRGLNWVKLYIEDPFFRYMFREFGII